MEVKPTVITIVPNDAIATTNAEMAERLRYLASEIEAGAAGNVDRVVVLIDTPDVLHHREYGPRASLMEVVGMLEIIKAKMLRKILFY